MYAAIVKSASPVFSSKENKEVVKQSLCPLMPQKIVICEYFLENKCVHGDNCRFAHHIDPEMSLEDIDFSKYKTTMCKIHEDGKVCILNKFNICLFAHDEEELLMPVCRFNQKCRNDSCKFRHYTDEEFEEFIHEEKTILKENRKEASIKINVLNKPKQVKSRTPKLKIDLSSSPKVEIKKEEK